MDKWMNKLESWNAYTALGKPRDILASFLFSVLLFFSVSFSFFLSLLPPSTSERALTLTTGMSLDRQNWGPFPYANRGPLLL